MKFEGYETLRLFGIMYPARLETLTEEEFRSMMEEKKRRRKNGNLDDHRLHCGYYDGLCD